MFIIYKCIYANIYVRVLSFLAVSAIFDWILDCSGCVHVVFFVSHFIMTLRLIYKFQTVSVYR